MNINSQYPVMVFRKEYEGNVFYSLGLSKKRQDGTYENGYMPCQFKKGVSLEDKTKIYLKSSWLTFYKKEKQTIPYIFINEFETVSEAIDNSKTIVKDETIQNDPFKDFGDELEITEDDLPF
jgi:hypothetical protein